LAEEEIHVLCDPSFVEVAIDEQERTAVRIVVEPRK
jgi:stage V sporulation protein SpoVS